jgi:hypothetical protein
VPGVATSIQPSLWAVHFYVAGQARLCVRDTRLVGLRGAKYSTRAGPRLT